MEKKDKYQDLGKQMKFQTFGNHDTEIVIIPWVMTWDGVVTEFHNSYRRQLGISDRMEAQLQRIVLQQSHNFVLRELGVAATGITCECDPARKRQAANMDRGPPLKEREDGQDSGVNNNGTSELARAITDLPGFTGAIKAAAKKLTESGNGDVIQAMGKLKEATTLATIIEKLADGLGTFIGYQGGNIKHDSTGIGLPNDPRERLGDAVLGFLYGMLSSLEKFRTYVGTVTGVKPDELKRAQGKGPVAVDAAIQKVGSLSITGSPVSQLQEVPNKLKEFKDFQSSSDLTSSAPKLKGYLQGLLEAVGKVNGITNSVAQTPLESLKTSLTGLVSDIESKWKSGPVNLNETVVKTKIEKVTKAQNDLSAALRKRRFSADTARYLVSAVISGTSQFLSQLKKAHYASSYNSTSTWDSTCKGSWGKMKFEGLGYDSDILWFMYSMGYSSSVLNGSKSGKDVVANVVKEKFAGFEAAWPNKKSYYDFHTTLHRTIPENFNNQTNSADALRALYYCASYCFTYKQSTISAPTNSPSNIREMLYFLAALPFSSEYGDLEKHIDTLFQRPIPISIGGIDHSKNPIFLNSANTKGNLPTTSFFATRILGLLQGPGDSKEKSGEPWLYHLFCNGMNLTYPSGSALFNALSNYTYAVNFQLSFLYKQCSGKYTESCGWRNCRFGSGVTTRNIESYICSAGCSESGHNNGDHSTNPKCKHED
ncbi:variant erythrocyte surface antigen-1, alpha subunit [Babesia caballi]|uniref:Variant erythrocyte surface antigen-1, alpha subunit n=1 Tax=Babesia caballi TaxID=5871 RepID=A0AAV4M1A7_BABCB|nr:variant erythrocyte surface antigen-1, alpha subunit [Babesia caballi]